MHNRQYDTRVNSGIWDGPPLLAVDVYSTIYKTPSFIYRVPLAFTEPYEEHLDLGRFVNYTPDEQTYVVKHDFEDYLVDWFTERLAWISDHVVYKWSFSLVSPSASAGTLTFSFENRREAIWFRLTY